MPCHALLALSLASLVCGLFGENARTRTATYCAISGPDSLKVGRAGDLTSLRNHVNIP